MEVLLVVGGIMVWAVFILVMVLGESSHDDFHWH